MKNLLLFVMSLLFLFVSSCALKKDKKHKKKDKQKQEEAAAINASPSSNEAPAAGCDTSLWRYVYNPSRLQVIDACKTVTGVIEESNADEDGDQHMLLKLDQGQENLLTKKNKKKKQGDLVIEAVCVNKTTLHKVGNTCQGYVNKIQLPDIGKHVRVTGSYVIDSHNGWAEIHPITALEIIK